MARCVTGKRMFPTSQSAEEALIDAWVKNDYPAGKGPVAVYQCLDCQCFHLTSSGVMNPALAKYIADGKLRLQKEANYWKGKFRS